MHSKTKVFWITKNGILNYNPEEHFKSAHKFLYWENKNECSAVLLIGNGDYGTGYSEHTDLHKCAVQHLKSSLQKQMRRMIIITKPVGAGVMKNNKIFLWSSYGFMVTTPNNLKNILENFILPKS